jgi:hypothetical protein
MAAVAPVDGVGDERWQRGRALAAPFRRPRRMRAEHRNFGAPHFRSLDFGVQLEPYFLHGPSNSRTGPHFGARLELLSETIYLSESAKRTVISVILIRTTLSQMTLISYY